VEEKKIKPIAEKKTFIEAHTGVLIGEGELYDLWIVKRAIFAYGDKG